NTERAGDHVEDVQFMSSFVQQHSTIFKGLLRTTECFYSKLDGKVETKCTAIEQIDLARYLPPLDNPRQLDKFSITHFLAHADETNLEYVESIDIPLDTRPDILNEIKDAQPFLHRCRRLDHIELPIFSPEMFAWAVRERNSLQMDLDNNGSVGYRNTRLESPLVLKKIRSPQPPLNTLIRPTSIKLLGLNHLNSRSVDDALFAFGDSLRELCILHEMSSRAHRLERDDWAYDLAIDQNWVDRLRCLRRIEISFRGSFRAWLHPEAISRLQLTELNITQTFYRGSTFPPELGESLVRPMHITSLKKLVLHGLASVNFHPDTLQSTKELETLELAMGRRLNLSENLFEPIPSVLLRQQDVLRNASWDWHLPHLKELTLSETFAAHFKFRMLRGCPSLRELTLHVPSARILSVEEMEECEANGIKDSTRAEGASGTGILQVDEKQVGVSTLTSLVLEGPWVISKEAWQVIARTVAPNVFFLSATGCSGCDPREWIEVTREMVCLRLAFGGAVDQENGSADDLREEYENEPVGKDYIIYRMDLGFYRVSRRSLGVCPD
ncbi:hypothetical protein BGW38_005347, partial [Lunasporangiospora selenospora]